jgi:hypothetical protein
MLERNIFHERHIIVILHLHRRDVPAFVLVQKLWPWEAVLVSRDAHVAAQWPPVQRRFCRSTYEYQISVSYDSSAQENSR